MSHRRKREHLLLVEITPMIDVVFLLIVFFLTTAQFARLTRADVDLPREQGEQEEEPEEAGMVVNITASGAIVVASETVTLNGLEFLVRQEMVRAAEQPGTPLKLLIRADRSADTAHLNKVVTRLQELKVGVARIATEVPR
ncbi:MAG: ExbD/TolR family protein [Planctomycetota bacterium]|jgi:biopolymer transport protein ExbD